MRPLVWLAGIDDSDGKMPPDMRWSFRDKDALAEDLERMIAWGPRRVILAHGRWYEHNGVEELERAFRKLLQARRWERAYDAYQNRDKTRLRRAHICAGDRARALAQPEKRAQAGDEPKEEPPCPPVLSCRRPVPDGQPCRR
jgi:hypothetical protein